MRPLTPRFLLCFFLGWLAGVTNVRSATGLALTIDCAFCGPGQTFPHTCPRASEATALPASLAFSSLLDDARKAVTRLRTIPDLNIPELGDVTYPQQLGVALDRVITAAEAEIARCERERAEYLRGNASASAQSTELTELAKQLQDEIAASRATFTEIETETAAQIRTASAAREEIIVFQKALREIRQEIWQVRNRLFPQLNQAARRGWILPPSSYRPMPTPLSPTAAPEAPTPDYPTHIASPTDADAAESARPTPTRPEISSRQFARRINAASQLEQLSALWERAHRAATEREDARRSFERQLTQTEAQVAQWSELQTQRTAVAARLSFAKHNLDTARQTRADFQARRTTARTAAVHAWIEWGIFQWLDQKAAALLTAPTGSNDFLDAWRDVAATSVQLGSDPLAVIEKFPATLAARGESLDDVRRNLAAAREKFGLAEIGDASGRPPAVRPYLEASQP